MREKYFLLLLISFLLLPFFTFAQGEAAIGGTVQSDTGEPLPGATVFIKGTYLGGSTNEEGRFQLKADFSKGPIVLAISFVGYLSQEISLDQPRQDINVSLLVSSTITAGVVVAASRVEEDIAQVPVTIEKVSLREVQNLTTPDLLSGLARFKAIDVSSSSMLTSSISTRGFNSSRSERVIQLADYMDTQLPSLSSNFGNLLGIPDLDVESIEIVHGPASALYGANAFNGVLLFNSKDPFTTEGLTVRARVGNRDLLDGQLRYARKIGERFAFKVSATAVTATDWLAESEEATNKRIEPGNNTRTSNLGYDAVNRYGDVGNTFTTGALAGKTVFLPGYTERELVLDDETHIYKVNPSISYLLTNSIKATLDYKYVIGNTTYQSASRYRFVNSGSHQARAEIKGADWFVRAYSTRDFSGNGKADGDAAYNLGFLGGFLQNSPVPGLLDPNGQPVSYAQRYLGTYATVYNQAFAANGGNADAAAAAARAFANTNAPQLQPGTPEFIAARDQIIRDDTPGKGARVTPRSFLNDISAQYRFNLEFVDLIVGAAYRQFLLGSNGTLFSDIDGGDRVPNHEYGAYAQVTKLLFDERLKLSAAGRVDRFKNFDTAFSPRVSAVYSAGVDKQQNFRLSYGRAYRAPTQTDQYVRIDVGRALVLGNIGNGFDGYTTGLLAPGANPDNNLYHADRLRLEEVNTAEIGYRALIGSKLYIDAAYFRSTYNDFIGTQNFIGNTDGTRPSLTQVGTAAAQGFRNPTLPTRIIQTSVNVAQEVQSQGGSVGLSYKVGTPLTLTANYSFNDLTSDDLPADFQTFFNTPRHKYNLGLDGQAMKRRVSYNVNYRWTDSFLYESTFATGQIAAYHTVDAQLGYTFPGFHTTVQAGVSNLFDAGNQQVYGGPSIGRLGYVGLLFDLH